VGRRGGRRTEVGGSGGLGAVVCGWWREGTQYHPPRPFNPPVLGGAVEPVSTPLPPTIHPTAHYTPTAGDDRPVCPCMCRFCLTYIYLHKKTYPPSNLPTRPSISTCVHDAAELHSRGELGSEKEERIGRERGRKVLSFEKTFQILFFGEKRSKRNASFSACR